MEVSVMVTVRVLHSAPRLLGCGRGQAARPLFLFSQGQCRAGEGYAPASVAGGHHLVQDDELPFVRLGVGVSDSIRSGSPFPASASRIFRSVSGELPLYFSAPPVSSPAFLTFRARFSSTNFF